MMKIRSGGPQDHEVLVEIWLRSVRATHHFLTGSDIAELLPDVRELALPNLELWVLCTEAGVPVGFMGLSGSSVEGLFLDPAHFRKGGGKQLLDHARRLKGRLRVDVNEQNPDALAFYRANGFEVIGRSETDAEGRPFPLLHMQEAVSSAE